LAFEKWYKDIGCQVCKVLSQTISGMYSYENPKENQVSGIYSVDQHCYEHKVSATTNNFIFVKKRMAQQSPKYSI
jgi:hypothetical protein